MSKKIKLIVGSTRQGRVGRAVADWVVNIAGENNVELEMLDLKEVNLSMFDGPSPSYFPPHTEEAKQWRETIGEADAFVFVTPEYNRSIPASLKNAIDYVAVEWKDKSAAIVSYGHVDGGASATKHLKDILDWFHVSYGDAVNIQLNQDLFTPEGAFKDIDGDLASYKQPIADALKTLSA